MLDHLTACSFPNFGHAFHAGSRLVSRLGSGQATPRVRNFVKPPDESRRARLCTAARHERPTAFTLVEMLVVLAIVGLIATLVIPAVTSILRGLQISQNGQLIESQLDLARQAALTNNRSVEVRLCQVNGSGKFSALLPLLVTTTVNTVNLNQPVYQPIGKPTFISDSVVIDSGTGSGTTLSTLVSPNGATAAAPITNYSNPPLGSYGQNYTYVSFRFKPDGTTDLNQSSLWFLTVHNATDPNPDPNPPNNYYTIQVDAYSGHVSQFRP